MFQKYQKEVYLSMVFVSIAVVGGFIAYNIKREHGGVGHGNVEYGNVEHGNVEHGNVEHGNVEHGNVEHVPVTTTSVRVAPIEEGDGAVRMLYSEEPRSGHGSAWPLGDEPLRMMSEFHEKSTPIFKRMADPKLKSIGSAAHSHNVDKDVVVQSEEERRLIAEEMRQRNAAKKIQRAARKIQRSLKQGNTSGGGTRKKRRTQRRKK